MVREYPIEKVKTLVYIWPENETIPALRGIRVIREVCPECYDELHEQGDGMKVLDCKNTFFRIVNGKKETVSQCCCYSRVHGERE